MHRNEATKRKGTNMAATTPYDDALARAREALPENVLIALGLTPNDDSDEVAKRMIRLGEARAAIEKSEIPAAERRGALEAIAQADRALQREYLMKGSAGYARVAAEQAAIGAHVQGNRGRLDPAQDPRSFA